MVLECLLTSAKTGDENNDSFEHFSCLFSFVFQKITWASPDFSSGKAKFSREAKANYLLKRHQKDFSQQKSKIY